MELLHSAIYLFEILILMVLGKTIFSRLYPSTSLKVELTEKDNLSFAFAFVGFLAAIILIAGGAIEGPDTNIWHDVLEIGKFGVIGLILLWISHVCVNKLFFSKVDLSQEIVRDQNPGAGIIQGASSLAVGMIIHASISGENHHSMPDWLSALVFWVIGLVLLFVALKLYFVFSKIKIQKEIERDNVAAGVASAGLILAVANLVRFGLDRDFHGWEDLAVDLSFECALGLILLPLARILADKMLLPGRSLNDEILQEKPNVGAGLIEAFTYIGTSLAITWCI
ncbi:MAG: uncharacterized membrane protein YjfL (UPF0719 family) [Luteibaculaceae bacterium]|jgi:uncharacterized membrane protein YjfL (UPF0719 family)